MISSFSTYFLRFFATILIFPFGWSLLVTAIILVNAPFRYMNSGCSGLSDCFGEKLLSVIQGESFLIEIGIATIIGAITVIGRLFELWLKDKRRCL